jgi:hypothetical protein
LRREVDHNAGWSAYGKMLVDVTRLGESDLGRDFRWAFDEADFLNEGLSEVPHVFTGKMVDFRKVHQDGQGIFPWHDTIRGVFPQIEDQTGYRVMQAKTHSLYQERICAVGGRNICDQEQK